MSAAAPQPVPGSRVETATLPVVVEGLTHRYPAANPPRSSRRAAPPANADQAAAATAPSGLALDGVSLAIRSGEIFGILGPNGGGKSTLFKILSTMLRPTGGSVNVFGYDVTRDPAFVREQLGVVFQSPSLDIKLTARENLLHQGHLYGLSGTMLRSRIADALARVNLGDRAEELVERFSGGMRRRVELAKALLHQPRLMLLDEPATGLDPNARRELWQQLELLRSRGVTIALTTHLMEEGDRCDRLAILSRGKLVALDTPEKLKSRIGGDVVTIEADAPGDAAAEQLAQSIASRFAPWTAGAEPRVADGHVRLEIANGAEFVGKLSAALPGKFRSITVGRPTLEDVFMHLTGKKLWNEDAPSND